MRRIGFVLSSTRLPFLATPSPRAACSLHAAAPGWAPMKAPMPRAYGCKDEPQQPTSFTAIKETITVIGMDDPAETLARLPEETFDRLDASRMEPAVRLKLLRQMRLGDHPEHRNAYDSGTPEDNARLLRWIDGALNQLLFDKGLWRPKGFTQADVKEQKTYKDALLRTLMEEQQQQIFGPTREAIGDEVVDQVLKESPGFLDPPAVVWETSEGEIEWMAKHTTEVTFPYLVDCTTEAKWDKARRYYERMARQFVRIAGGTSHGLGGGAALPEPGVVVKEPEPPAPETKANSSRIGRLDDDLLQQVGGGPSRK